MKTKPLQYMTLKSFSPSSSSVSYTGKADGTTEVTRPLYFIEDKTNLRVKIGVNNFVIRHFFCRIYRCKLTKTWRHKH